MQDFSKLPAPPKGQKGMTPDDFSHLPPPPKGQQGFTLDEIKGNNKDRIASENQAYQKESQYFNSPLGIAKQTANNTVANILNPAAKFLKSAINAPVDIVRGFMGKAPITDNTGFPTIQSDMVQKTSDVFDQKKSPVRATLESTGATVGGASDVLGLGEVGTKAATKAADYLAPKITGALEKQAAKQATKEALKVGEENTKLAETISPPTTKKEVKLAQQQGRLIEGKEPTLFKSGTPDKLATSNKTADAVRTVQRTIPNASKMKPSELYQAAGDQVTKTYKALEPEMKKTPIRPETIEKINSDWEALKKAQIKSADATEEANVLKQQKQFEERLMKSGNQTHDDLWKTRVEYDASVSENVKKANSLSSESLQNKREIWLQNRDVLNKAINDTTYGMGQTSKQAFSDMTNLYEVQNALNSKATLNPAQLSKIKQTLKDNPEAVKAVKYILYGLGAESMIKRLTGLGF